MTNAATGRVVADLDRSRLQTGRQLRKMSQTELSGRIDISAAAISQFENGHARPTAATLDKIAGALDLPIGYFGRRRGGTVETPDAYFRSLRSTTVGQRRFAEALAGLVHEVALAIEQHVDLPKVDLPRAAGVRSDAAIDDAAAAAREHMGLDPDLPVPDVVVALERHGAVTASLRIDAREMDAFSVAYPDRPVIVLGSDKGYRDRSRFDAAHELGHLVLHDPAEAGTKEAEKQAHRFAAAFLMPAHAIEPYLDRKADWNRLLEAKQTWEVSIAALLMRARTLKLMDEHGYTQAMKTMSVRRWRNPEPGDLGPPERPRVLAAALRQLEADDMTLDNLADQHALPINDLRNILRPSLNPRPRVTI